MIRRHPQATAWFIVLTGFLCFCLVCSASSYAFYWFFFQSPVPLNVHLSVSRGSVKFQTLNNDNPLVEDEHAVDSQTLLEVRDDSQAILYFRDSYSGQDVAAITLTAGSKVFVSEASRPRFEFSRRPYNIVLNRTDGQLNVVASPGERGLLMDIKSALGTARLTDDGRYTVNTEYYPDTGLRRLNVFNQGGETVLFNAEMSEGRRVNPNMIAHITNSGFESESAPPYEILAAGMFASDTPVDANGLPSGWQCQQVVADRSEPFGTLWRDPSERFTLHMVRSGESMVNHAETRCFLDTDANGGLNTTPYNSLRLHMRIKLKSQDLTGCGVRGSECPIMAEIAYRLPGDTPDTPLHKWNHGFYLTQDSTKPQTCDTCRAAHERINPDVWYFYDSGELGPQLGKDPPLVQWISVYASGHQWDSLVSEITLLGSKN